MRKHTVQQLPGKHNVYIYVCECVNIWVCLDEIRLHFYQLISLFGAVLIFGLQIEFSNLSNYSDTIPRKNSAFQCRVPWILRINRNSYEASGTDIYIYMYIYIYVYIYDSYDRYIYISVKNGKLFSTLWNLHTNLCKKYLPKMDG